MCGGARWKKIYKPLLTHQSPEKPYNATNFSRRLAPGASGEIALRYAAVCGQDTFGIQKPDPQMLRLTIRRAGGDVRHAIMIGDSLTDVRTARAANVPVIAVDFGYSEVPAALNADRLISSFGELPHAIAAVGTPARAAAAAAIASLRGGSPP
jgi:ribonucleotide monophosphatase NagD (HAD superfamily)